MNSSPFDWQHWFRRDCRTTTAPERRPRTLDDSYRFSEAACRALFFAKYNASLRDDDAMTHSITLDDLEHGIARERGQRKNP